MKAFILLILLAIMVFAADDSDWLEGMEKANIQNGKTAAYLAEYKTVEPIHIRFIYIPRHEANINEVCRLLGVNPRYHMNGCAFTHKGVCYIVMIEETGFMDSKALRIKGEEVSHCEGKVHDD